MSRGSKPSLVAGARAVGTHIAVHVVVPAAVESADGGWRRVLRAVSRNLSNRPFGDASGPFRPGGES